MAVVQQELEIDGVKYSVTQLTGWKSVKMLPRLGRALGPAFGKLMGGLAQNGEFSLDRKVTFGLVAGSIGPALVDLFERLTENELEGIARVLLETATFTDESGRTAHLLPVFDIHFQGKPASVLRLLAFAIEVNYGSFFDVAVALARPYMTKATASSEISPSP